MSERERKGSKRRKNDIGVLPKTRTRLTQEERVCACESEREEREK